MGYCYDGKTLKYGTVNMTTDGEGSRSYLPAVKLKKWLENWHTIFGFRGIAFEETFARGAAKLRLDSMQTVCAIYCIERNMPWWRISASSLKKFATGNGRCGKEQMVEASMQFFPEITEPPTYDEADAICVLAWAKGMER